jgi:hypothetical protein
MPRTVNVRMPTGVRRRTDVSFVSPVRDAKTSVTTMLAGSTRNPSGSSTTWSPDLTRWSVFTAWPSLTSAAKTASASPAAGPSTAKKVSVTIGTA